MAAVRQEDLAQLLCYMGTVNGAFKAFLDETGQKPAVVDMGMAEYNRVDFTRVKGKWFAIEAADQFGPLEHATVKQDFLAAHFKHVAGTCYDLIGTEEPDLHDSHLP